MSNPVLESIRNRRSVRKFTDEDVSEEKIEEILESARWAPSGKNNQPWKFLVVKRNETKFKIAECTRYSATVKDASVLILVYFDKEKGYDRTKDLQSIGACCQNMWMAIHSLKLGAVWNGEILNKKDRVKDIMDTPENLELMALFCIGYPAENPVSDRVPIEDLIIDKR